MPRQKNYSISRRLTIMNMVVSGIALLIAGIVMFAYDFITFRESLMRRLATQAEITGYNSVSALLFDDSVAAEETLRSLQASPNIVSAVITTADGETFASYLRDEGSIVPPTPSIPAGEIDIRLMAAGEIGYSRQIVSEGEPIGAVHIRAQLTELNDRLISYVGIAVIIFVFSLGAALFVSQISKRAISEPLTNLAEIARRVSRERNYSLRAPPMKRGGELSVLTNSLNDMLAQIQERDRALEMARLELEKRVDERTAQLAAANKELEAFSYSVSHDLRAPLRHIDGFSTILAQKYGPSMDPAAQRYLSYVREGAKNMGQLVDDLLSMGRITRQEMVRTATDLNVVLQNVLKEVKRDLEGRNIEWRIAGLPTVEVDAHLLGVVFTNLLSNAAKYSRNANPAIIEVGTMQQEDGKRVYFVRDNGAGFEQQYAHKLFGVFQRLHRSEDFEGTGVGLATVQRIINRHGGRIWAEGEVNKGATFYFTLA